MFIYCGSLIGATRPHQGVVLQCHPIEPYRAKAREVDSGELIVGPDAVELDSIEEQQGTCV
jgi:hypothetical protein